MVGWRWISGHNNKWLKRLMSISMLEIVAMQFNEFLLPLMSIRKSTSHTRGSCRSRLVKSRIWSLAVGAIVIAIINLFSGETRSFRQLNSDGNTACHVTDMNQLQFSTCSDWF